MNNLKFKLPKTQSSRPYIYEDSAGQSGEELTSLSKALKKISIDMAGQRIKLYSSMYDIKKNNNIVFGEITYKLHKLTKKTEEDFECISMPKLKKCHEISKIDAANKFTRKIVDYLNVVTQGVFNELSDYYKSDNLAYIILPDYNYNVVDGKSNEILTADELSLYLNNEEKNIRVANNLYLETMINGMIQYCLEQEEEMLSEVEENNLEKNEPHPGGVGQGQVGALATDQAALAEQVSRPCSSRENMSTAFTFTPQAYNPVSAGLSGEDNLEETESLIDWLSY